MTAVDVASAFDAHTSTRDTALKVSKKDFSVKEWEHIQHVLVGCEYNISEAARQLGMHRRTLQRKLQKRQYFNES